jgi:hypothetical protein
LVQRRCRARAVRAAKEDVIEARFGRALNACRFDAYQRLSSASPGAAGTARSLIMKRIFWARRRSTTVSP